MCVVLFFHLSSAAQFFELSEVLSVVFISYGYVLNEQANLKMYFIHLLYSSLGVTKIKTLENEDLRPVLIFEITKTKTPLNRIHRNIKLN